MNCIHCNGTGMEPDNKVTGTNMFVLRRRSGISQKDMARELKVSQAFLCQLEAGNRRWTPRMERNFKAVCRKV